MMKIQYRLALLLDSGGHWMDIANTESDVRRIQGYADFIRWIHDEWQHMDISKTKQITDYSRI